ncbi:hypothetical protein O6H91_13G072900 [Diphasiastrum complanatum]|uniref:Uncharacterized protein n=1 Tax=Diphasiastrum complanatum TaxID=34168 RepID=A0ACC2BW67_DIPCM|nr:hypothetical protein O6H91_13G072900 [Diphasiastrum complanatum]
MKEEVPVVDFAPFLAPDSTEAIAEKRKALLQEISKACEEWGFFQVINHGMNWDLVQKTFRKSQEFFWLPLEDKLKAQPAPGSSPYPTGFNNKNRSQGVQDKKELLFFFTDESSTDASKHAYSQYNIWPDRPLHFRSVVEEYIQHAERTMKCVMAIVSESLGLPSNFLANISQEKLNMFMMHYYPQCIAENDRQGLGYHRDGGIITMVAQDGVEGYQVLKGDKWVTIKPIEGALTFNVSDCLQVWTNGRYKSVLHRVRNHKTHERFSFAFETTPSLHAQMAPLPQFTTDIGKPPEYRPFEYMEYLMIRLKNKSLLPNQKEGGLEDFAV